MAWISPGELAEWLPDYARCWLVVYLHLHSSNDNSNTIRATRLKATESQSTLMHVDDCARIDLYIISRAVTVRDST